MEFHHLRIEPSTDGARRSGWDGQPYGQRTAEALLDEIEALVDNGNQKHTACSRSKRQRIGFHRWSRSEEDLQHSVGRRGFKSICFVVNDYSKISSL